MPTVYGIAPMENMMLNSQLFMLSLNFALQFLTSQS